MFLIGHWRNFDELEEHLTIAELEAIVVAQRKKEEADRRFAASLKGIKLPSSQEQEDQKLREEIQRRADAKIRGVTEDTVQIEQLGIAIIED